MGYLDCLTIGVHASDRGYVLQLADLIAYPVKQICLLEKGLIADPGDVFGKEVVKQA
jgi:hypothetical protein